MEQRKLRSAIVGCGVIHSAHADAISQLPEHVELVAVADDKLERAAKAGEALGVPHFHGLDALLAWGEFDILHVCTPSGLHAACGIKGANAGKHILCEKPIDVTLPAADALIEACAANNVKLEVVSQHRFSDGMQHLKTWLDEGKFGRLVFGESVTKWYRTQAYYDSGGWRGTWELDGGGALMNQGVHYVDQLRWIMGPIKSVAATMGTLSHERIEVEDIVSATIEFENGAVGTLMASTSMVPGFNQSLEVYGSKGSVRITNSKVMFAQFVTGDEPQTMWGLEGTPAPVVVDGVWQNDDAEAETTTQGQGAADPRAISNLGHVAHLKDLCECIHSGAETFMNGREARYALELIVAVYRSAKTGQRVMLPLEA